MDRLDESASAVADLLDDYLLTLSRPEIRYCL